MSGKWHTQGKRLAHQQSLNARDTSENMRDRYGCICTLRNEDTGEYRTLQRNGFRKDALIAIAEWCDQTPGDWKVVSYSTPSTIVADMHGGRSAVFDRQQTTESKMELPEVRVLGAIGRFDLVAPELIAHTDHEARRSHGVGRRRSA
jgi:hypothetical protein